MYDKSNTSWTNVLPIVQSINPETVYYGLDQQAHEIGGRVVSLPPEPPKSSPPPLPTVPAPLPPKSPGPSRGVSAVATDSVNPFQDEYEVRTSELEEESVTV